MSSRRLLELRAAQRAAENNLQRARETGGRNSQILGMLSSLVPTLVNAGTGIVGGIAGDQTRKAKEVAAAAALSPGAVDEAKSIVQMTAAGPQAQLGFTRTPEEEAKALVEARADLRELPADQDFLGIANMFRRQGREQALGATAAQIQAARKAKEDEARKGIVVGTEFAMKQQEQATKAEQAKNDTERRQAEATEKRLDDLSAPYVLRLASDASIGGNVEDGIAKAVQEMVAQYPTLDPAVVQGRIAAGIDEQARRAKMERDRERSADAAQTSAAAAARAQNLAFDEAVKKSKAPLDKQIETAEKFGAIKADVADLENQFKSMAAKKSLAVTGPVIGWARNQFSKLGADPEMTKLNTMIAAANSRMFGLLRTDAPSESELKLIEPLYAKTNRTLADNLALLDAMNRIVDNRIGSLARATKALGRDEGIIQAITGQPATAPRRRPTAPGGAPLPAAEASVVDEFLR